MATAREQLMQELARRKAIQQGDDTKLRGMIKQQEDIAKLDPNLRVNLQPTAAMVDLGLGAKDRISQTIGQQESTQDALRKALQYRMQQPKVQTDALELALAKNAGGQLRQMSAGDVMKVQEGENIPIMLEDVTKVIDQNADIFGPIQGRLHGANPWDTQGKTVDAQIRAASQAFGRFMEGGVLRKEDEEKYRKMFPNLSDTPDVAKNKLGVVQRLMQQRQAGNVQALGQAGFDVSPFAGGGQGANLVQAGDGNTVDFSQLTDEQLRKIAGK